MRRIDEKLYLYGRIFLSSFETIAIILTLTGLSGCTIKNGESSELREADISVEETSSSVQESDTSSQSGNIYVYACGEVRTPGVYELPPDSRVFQVIEAAGGMTENAAESGINQAEKLSDGQQVYVPSGEEVSKQSGQSGNESQVPEPDDGKVNLNTAAKEELMLLSGIGEVKAEAIIRYREEKGGFTSIEELKEIEGIKDGVFNKVKDQIKI